MGSYQSTYLGPYLEARARKESRPTDLFGCTNPKCEVYSQRQKYSALAARPEAKKFCAQCGVTLGKTTEVLPYRPSPFDALKEREQLTWIEDSSDTSLFYFLPNFRRPGRLFHLPDREEVHWDLRQSSNPTEETAWFQERFAEDIANVAESYDVEIRWGLHVYWS